MLVIIFSKAIILLLPFLAILAEKLLGVGYLSNFLRLRQSSSHIRTSFKSTALFVTCLLLRGLFALFFRKSLRTSDNFLFPTSIIFVRRLLFCWNLSPSSFSVTFLRMTCLFLELVHPLTSSVFSVSLYSQKCHLSRFVCLVFFSLFCVFGL